MILLLAWWGTLPGEDFSTYASSLAQGERGQSDAFRTLIRQRRGQRTLSRGELEARLADQQGRDE